MRRIASRFAPVLMRTAAIASIAVAAKTGAADTLDAKIARAGAALIRNVRSSDIAAIESRFSDRLRRVLPHDAFVALIDVDAMIVGTPETCDAPAHRRVLDLTAVEYRCRSTRGPMIVRLVWSPGLRLDAILITPEPVAAPPRPLPDGVRQEEFVGGAPGWPSKAVLLSPTTDGKPPVFVLVQGSGVWDRDGPVAGRLDPLGPGIQLDATSKPMRDLAIAFATRGIASLRYDKRAVAHADRYDRELRRPTLDDDLVDDAVAGLTIVAKRSDLGPVFIVGHSEGAWLAPRIAAAATARGIDVEGIVMLAAPNTPPADLLIERNRIRAELPGSPVSPALVIGLRESLARVRRSYRTPLGSEEPIKVAMVASGLLSPNMASSFWNDVET